MAQFAAWTSGRTRPDLRHRLRARHVRAARRRLHRGAVADGRAGLHRAHRARPDRGVRRPLDPAAGCTGPRIIVAEYLPPARGGHPLAGVILGRDLDGPAGADPRARRGRTRAHHRGREPRARGKDSYELEFLQTRATGRGAFRNPEPSADDLELLHAIFGDELTPGERRQLGTTDSKALKRLTAAGKRCGRCGDGWLSQAVPHRSGHAGPRRRHRGGHPRGPVLGHRPGHRLRRLLARHLHRRRPARPDRGLHRRGEAPARCQGRRGRDHLKGLTSTSGWPRPTASATCSRRREPNARRSRRPTRADARPHRAACSRGRCCSATRRRGRGAGPLLRGGRRAAGWYVGVPSVQRGGLRRGHQLGSSSVIRATRRRAADRAAARSRAAAAAAVAGAGSSASAVDFVWTSAGGCVEIARAASTY